jgi:hypothetical protein
MRDDAFQRIGPGGSNMKYYITSVQNNRSAQIAREIQGMLEVTPFRSIPQYGNQQ